MSTTVVGIIVLGFVCIMLCVWVWLAISDLFSTLFGARRELKRQAQLDYRNSRGCAHRRLLEKATAQLTAESQRNEMHLKTLRARQGDLQSRFRTELMAALQHSIASSRLTEVEGIGYALQQRILESVFRGSLSDLNNAYLVQGIGETRQAAIRRWVHSYEMRLTSLLQEDFPGKGDILDKYAGQNKAVSEEIRILERRQHRIRPLEQRGNQELWRLPQVSERDFVRARVSRNAQSADVDFFVQGVFAEWEPVPQWFNDLLWEGRHEDS